MYLSDVVVCNIVLQKIVFDSIEQDDKSQQEEVISIIKMFAWVCENFIEIVAMSKRTFTKMAFEKCCYEKRNTRENMALTILKCKS